MNFFDWQTEESEDRLFTTADPSPAPVKKYGRKLFLLLALLTLMSAAIYWQLDRRAEAQAAVFEADVLAAFSLWQQAIIKSDEDIFDTLLVGSEPGWATGQRNLFLSGQLLDRSKLNLLMAFDEKGLLEQSEVRVYLSPDWTTAEISFEQVYNLTDHPGETLNSLQHIRLAQNLNFRRSADRWFLAPPPNDFWGEWKTEETAFLTIRYPKRDEEIALRLAQDLSADLTAVCSSLPGADCDEQAGVEIRFETDNTAPTLWNGWETTLVDGRLFLVPAPSLVGRPVDDAGYNLLYNRYTGPILAVFKAWNDTPVPLPDQELQLICYPPDGRVPKLIRFVSPDEWVVDLPDKSFRYLSPMVTDEGIILQEYLPGQDSSQMRLTLWQGGQETLVYDDDFNHLMLYPVGWSGSLNSPHLLLHGYDQFPTATSYRQVDLSNCDEKGCQVNSLVGYPVWSPNGRHTILQDSGKLYTGSSDGLPEQEIGRGIAPFWIDNERFGYLRYLAGSEAEIQSGRMEIVLADFGGDAGQQLLTTPDFSPEVPSYFSYVTVNPDDPNELFVALRSYMERQEVKIFSVQLRNQDGTWAVDNLTQLLVLDRATVGFPSLTASNGFVPFVVSVNVRWISGSSPSLVESDTWTIYAYDTELAQTHLYTVSYPSNQFIHPYYDWSKDGNWLVIVEQNYLRLIAPGYNYERLIAHNLRNCSHVAWVDPIPD